MSDVNKFFNYEAYSFFMVCLANLQCVFAK